MNLVETSIDAPRSQITYFSIEIMWSIQSMTDYRSAQSENNIIWCNCESHLILGVSWFCNWPLKNILLPIFFVSKSLEESFHPSWVFIATARTLQKRRWYSTNWVLCDDMGGWLIGAKFANSLSASKLCVLCKNGDDIQPTEFYVMIWAKNLMAHGS